MVNPNGFTMVNLGEPNGEPSVESDLLLSCGVWLNGEPKGEPVGSPIMLIVNPGEPKMSHKTKKWVHLFVTQPRTHSEHDSLGSPFVKIFGERTCCSEVSWEDPYHYALRYRCFYRSSRALRYQLLM